MRRSFKAKKQKNPKPTICWPRCKRCSRNGRNSKGRARRRNRHRFFRRRGGYGHHYRPPARAAIEINEELINPEDQEMLQDMLVAAVNAAIEQSQAMAAERMEGVTGGMGGGLQDMLGGLGL
jgi:hypothetical protein